jgi:hypothetical protein
LLKKRKIAPWLKFLIERANQRKVLEGLRVMNNQEIKTHLASLNLSNIWEIYFSSSQTEFVKYQEKIGS